MTMIPISDCELASIRAALVDVLDLSCTIQRKTITRDTWASAEETWETVATVQSNLDEPTTGELQEYANKIGSSLAWKVNLPYGTTVEEQYRLLIADRTLLVQARLAPRSFPVYTSVLVTEVG